LFVAPARRRARVGCSALSSQTVILPGMYAPFFGLKREPFSIAPDPRYLFMSERHREALAHLLYGLGAGGGFVLLTGSIGAGKTTVCRCFLEQIPKRCNVAYIFNPKLTVEELLQSICTEFGIPLAAAVPGTPATVKSYVDPLNEFLLRTHAVGQNNVLIIDEAQMLAPDVLEQLRLLTNLETSERKLLQVVLIGQPELREMLARPDLEQLAQRVVARFHLDALSEAETAQYIEHRLAVAGLAGASPFDAAAMRRIHALARGVPRRINLLCDRALLGAYAGNVARVDLPIIERAAAEVFGVGAPRRRRSRERRAAAWGAGVALLAGGAVLLAMAALWRPATAVLSSTNASPGASGPARPASAPAPVAMPPLPAASLALTGALAAPASPASAADLARVFATSPRSEAEAWRLLAPLWKLAPLDGEPCTAAPRQQVQCFRGNLEPALLRRLDRPGLLTLRDPAGRTAYVMLVGLSAEAATLRSPQGLYRVPLAQLAQWWRGDFATFWRAPPGYSGVVVDGSAGPPVDWLAQQLAALNRAGAPAASQPAGEALRAQLLAFQLAHELRPDGIAGPTTFMQINRARGVDEPRLIAPASAS